MARYIYLLYESERPREILQAFTDKDAMLAYRAEYPFPTYWVRHEDGVAQTRPYSGPRPEDPDHRDA